MSSGLRAPAVTTRPAAPRFPVLRWFTLVWVAAWFPIYWHFWGWSNFLHFSDAAILLTCLGLWTHSALLLSSQATGMLVASAEWCLEVCFRAVAGHGLFGGTEYLWNSSVPLWVRLLTFYHLLLEVVLIYAISKTGYDRRGLALQAGITAMLMVLSRWLAPGQNINFSERDPILHRAWGPAPLHLALVLAGLVLVAFLPAHLLLARLFPRPTAGDPSSPLGVSSAPSATDPR
jgi:hypothetical protein